LIFVFLFSFFLPKMPRTAPHNNSLSVPFAIKPRRL
jgi:hypothetical protein